MNQTRIAVAAALLVLVALGAWLFVRSRGLGTGPAGGGGLPYGNQAGPSASGRPPSGPATARKTNPVFHASNRVLPPGYANNYPELRAKHRKRIAEIAAARLGSAETIRGLSCAEWRKLAEELGPEMKKRERQAWAGLLRSAFAPNREAWRTLKPQEVRDLATALALLWEADCAALLSGWFGDEEAWKTFPAEVLAELARRALYPGLEGRQVIGEETMQRVEALCRQSGVTDFGPYRELAWAWVGLGNNERAAAMATRACQALLQSPDQGTLKDMADLSAVAAEVRAAPVAAEAWAELAVKKARQGGFEADYAQPKNVAYLATGAAGRKVLQDNWLDAQGRPVLEVAKVLVWVQVHDGAGLQFRETIAEKLRAADDTNKVFWLLTQGYIQEAIHNDSGQRAVAFIAAQRAAKTEEEQLAVLRERVGSLREGGFYAQALYQIEQAKGRLSGAGQALAEALEKDTVAAGERWQLVVDREQARSEENRKQARLEYLRECAARARQGGDQKELGRIETELGSLEQELK